MDSESPSAPNPLPEPSQPRWLEEAGENRNQDALVNLGGEPQPLTEHELQEQRDQMAEQWGESDPISDAVGEVADEYGLGDEGYEDEYGEDPGGDIAAGEVLTASDRAAIEKHKAERPVVYSNEVEQAIDRKSVV